jgi:hypothetical protein
VKFRKSIDVPSANANPGTLPSEAVRSESTRASISRARRSVSVPLVASTGGAVKRMTRNGLASTRTGGVSGPLSSAPRFVRPLEPAGLA